MTHFKAIWEIDVFTDDPISGAKEAQNILKTHLSTNWVFDMVNVQTGYKTRVDLKEVI